MAFPLIKRSRGIWGWWMFDKENLHLFANFAYKWIPKTGGLDERNPNAPGGRLHINHAASEMEAKGTSPLAIWVFPSTLEEDRKENDCLFSNCHWCLLMVRSLLLNWLLFLSQQFKAKEMFSYHCVSQSSDIRHPFLSFIWFKVCFRHLLNWLAH